MSGARPADRSGIRAGVGHVRRHRPGHALDTLYTMPPTSSRQSAAATSHALRSDAAVAGPLPAHRLPTPMAETGLGRQLARQAAQARVMRPAPHAAAEVSTGGCAAGEGQVMREA